MKSKSKKIAVVFFLYLGLTAFQGALHAEVPGTIPTGVIEFDEFKEPVFGFVPDGYKKIDPLTMLIVMPSGSRHSETFSEWKPLAEKEKLVLITPYVVIRPGDVPVKVDEWIGKIVKALTIRYGIKRVFLIGLGENAHYVSYLGLREPDIVDAVASVGGSWVGPLEQVINPSNNPKKQMPFFTAISEKSDEAAATQAKAEDLMKRGYKVQLVMLTEEGEEDSDTFKSELLTWLQAQAESAGVSRKKTKTTFKEKASKAWEEFFTV